VLNRSKVICQFIWCFILNSKIRFKVTSGLPKEGHLSPLLFNLFINKVILNTPPCRILPFTDNTKLVALVTSTSDCHVDNRFIIWCNAIGLTFNTTKCKLMFFFRSQTLIDYNYFLSGSILKRIFETKYLRFLYSTSCGISALLEEY